MGRPGRHTGKTQLSTKLEINPSPVQLQFLQADQDIVLFGGGAGGGKTWSALVDNLQGVHDPDYFSVVMRTTSTEIEKGLWPEALKMYDSIIKDKSGKYIGKSHISEKTKTITFPSGARSTFTFLATDKDANSWYGSELTKIYFEEFQFRSYYQFDVLRSRNRSRAKVKCGIRCTLNPDPNHFVAEWVAPFLDEEFFPIKELSGKTRYFIIVNDIFHSSWDADELEKEFGKNPNSYTYIPATIEDNKYLDDSYRDKLDSLSEKKRKQLLLGCWAPLEDSGIYLQRSMFRKADGIPLGCRTVRGWDTAGTAPPDGQESTRDADWSVGIKMSKSPSGEYYIHGMERFQDRSGPRDNKIFNTGHRDGVDCHIILASDVGSAGNFMFMETSKRATAEGLILHKDPMPVNKSKLARAEAFITAVQNGLVYIVENSFDDKGFSAIQYFWNEMELFTGERSKRGKHDDIVDATATAFNYLAQEKVIPQFTLPSNNSPTRFKQVMSTTVPVFN